MDYRIAMEKRAVAALRSALAQHAGLHLSMSEHGQGLRVRYQDASTDLAPVWAGEGFPRDVEQVLSSRSFAALQRAHGTPVIVARRISKGAQEVLERNRLSWVDETGRAAISAPPGLLVFVEKEPRTVRAPSGDVRWSEVSGLVAEELLLEAQEEGPREAHRLRPVAEIADAVGASRSMVSRTLQTFDAQGWTAKAGAERGVRARRELVRPGALLSAWGGWYSTQERPSIQAHAIVSDTDSFVSERLSGRWEAGTWALTGWLALERVAPFMTTAPTISVYLDPHIYDDPTQLAKLLEVSGLRPVERGGRVEILRGQPYTLRRSRSVSGILQVRDVRLYGDLLRAGARGPDAAEHLRETRIRL